jgi:tetratricopeptide (TPR) repeat protein
MRQHLVRLRASALAAAGRRQEAIAAYAQLAEQLPDDGQVQESYAALLAGSDSAADLRAALVRWQQVEQRSRPGSTRWYRARQARIELLRRLGDHEAEEKLLRLTRLLYPDWDRRGAE